MNQVRGHRVKFVTGCAPQSVRSTDVGLLLIIAMSAIDPIWTILSGSAGLMNAVRNKNVWPRPRTFALDKWPAWDSRPQKIAKHR